ncbi:MAG: hypothetical protein HZA35_01050 [Parcubacteria group bacterium]|nr:hypothetical protein [Parcubacteria group bacterium]
MISRRVSKNSNNVSDYAKAMLKSPLFIPSNKEEITLVRLTVADLGFKEGARYKDIIARAKELGLDYCPAEVGPQLRLQYQDQPSGEWLRIATKPIIGPNNIPSVFSLGHGVGGLWLDDDWVGLGSEWYPYVIAR